MKSEGQRPQRWEQNLCLVCQTRSARLKFVKRYKSVTLHRGWDDYYYCQIFSGFSYFLSNPLQFRLHYYLTVFVVFAADIPAYVRFTNKVIYYPLYYLALSNVLTEAEFSKPLCTSFSSSVPPNHRFASHRFFSTWLTSHRFASINFVYILIVLSIIIVAKVLKLKRVKNFLSYRGIK